MVFIESQQAPQPPEMSGSLLILAQACLNVSGEQPGVGPHLERLLTATQENCLHSLVLVTASLALAVCGKCNSKQSLEKVEYFS